MKSYVDYENYLNEDVCKIIQNYTKLLIIKECAFVVQKEIEKEKNGEFDQYFGHLDGINKVLDRKDHVYSNMLCFESRIKRGIYNVGLVPCKYALLYLCQEEIFNSAYQNFISNASRNIHRMSVCPNIKVGKVWKPIYV